MPYLLDLHLFLSKPVRPAPTEEEVASDRENVLTKINEAMEKGELIYGRFPQSVLDMVSERIRELIDGSTEVIALQKACTNAFHLYSKTKPTPSTESVKRAKGLPREGLHPIFKNEIGTNEAAALAFSERLKEFRPKQTVLETEGEAAKAKHLHEARAKRLDSAVAVQARLVLPEFTYVSNDDKLPSSADFEALGEPKSASVSSPVFNERKLFSHVTRLGLAAGHDSPALREGLSREFPPGSVASASNSINMETVGVSADSGNLTCKFYNNMRREAVAVRIQKHVCRYKAQKAQKHVQCGYRSMCADRNLRKWAIEYEEPVAEAFPLIMKTLLLRVSSC